MVLLLAGVISLFLACGLFVYSLPRGGKFAWFVGSQWEPYITILIVSGFVLGVLFAVTGAIRVLGA
ncbi:MAG TPA: hypothetical protein VK877_13055 [Pseudolabrys sp.]|nr:hypothetical protein [Pseudolabrys sp.]